MRAIFVAAGVILAAGLAGCTSMQSAVVDAYVEQGEFAIKAQHDREARIFKQVICSTSLGGMARIFTAREQELAAELCGLQIGASSDLRDDMLRYLMEQE